MSRGVNFAPIPVSLTPEYSSPVSPGVGVEFDVKGSEDPLKGNVVSGPTVKGFTELMEAARFGDNPYANRTVTIRFDGQSGLVRKLLEQKGIKLQESQPE